MIFKTGHPKYRWGIQLKDGTKFEIYRTKKDAQKALEWFQQWFNG